MTNEQIFNEVRDVLVKDFECDPAAIKPEAHLVNDLDFDSIDAVDLVVRLQQRTGIKVVTEDFKTITMTSTTSPSVVVVTEDFKTITTLGDVVDVISKLLEQRAG